MNSKDAVLSVISVFSVVSLLLGVEAPGISIIELTAPRAEGPKGGD